MSNDFKGLKVKWKERNLTGTIERVWEGQKGEKWCYFRTSKWLWSIPLKYLTR
jgi:hypothetical protein